MVVPREPLTKTKGKQRLPLDDQGNWRDQEQLPAIYDPIPTPTRPFGVAYVTLDDKTHANHAIDKLNETGCVSFEPPFTPILC